MEFWITSAAKRDLASAFDAYWAKGAGLGADFMRCVDVAIALIRRSPQLFWKPYGEVRIAMMPRFPYALYFIWDEEAGLISVRRILHFSQNVPAYLG